MLDLPEHACLFLLDAVSFVLVVAVFLGIKSGSTVPTFSKAFSPYDRQLMVPYQEGSVSAGFMSISSHLTPMVMVCILCVLRSVQKDGFNTKLLSPVPTKGLGRIQIPSGVMAALFYIGYFLYGASLMAIFVILTEHLTGELSPNFLSVCQPKFDNSNLTVVLTREACAGNEKSILKASLSFPSQYAAHLSYGFVFNICTVFCIPQLRSVPFTQHLLLFIMLTIPVIGSITRYIDGYNHPWDIVAGFLIGSASAVYVVLVPLRLFGLHQSPAYESRPVPTQLQNVTFDELTALPYTDLQSDHELDN